VWKAWPRFSRGLRPFRAPEREPGSRLALSKKEGMVFTQPVSSRENGSLLDGFLGLAARTRTWTLTRLQ
jgi:hypothetical protein